MLKASYYLIVGRLESYSEDLAALVGPAANYAMAVDTFKQRIYTYYNDQPDSGLSVKVKVTVQLARKTDVASVVIDPDSVEAYLDWTWSVEVPPPSVLVLEVMGTEADVCRDIARRQAVGIPKYKTTVRENRLKLRAWLLHHYEELLDACIYARRSIEEVDAELAVLPEPKELGNGS